MFRSRSRKWLNIASVVIILGITVLVLVQLSNIKVILFPPRDEIPPFINITYPSYSPTLLSGNITLRGITNDSSGIKAISADAHTFPFNGTMPLKPASVPSLIPEGDWSKWSVPFNFSNPGVYRIVVTVRDNADNLEYVETTVNVVPSNDNPSDSIQKNPRIAFVRYTFTEAAYRQNGFYDFYFKHGFPSSDIAIRNDLNFLIVKTIPSTSEIISNKDLLKLSNITTLLPEGKDFDFWLPFVNHVKKVAPNATLTVIRDEDVHDGHIFNQVNNKSNAFDMLLLFHNEYVTQTEYDNLRQFVSNGGTIMFIDSNVVYAEVRYDRNNDTISLVKGHDWEFNGKVARSSLQERWFNETKEWVGGNFLATDISEDITFTNNPFNYTHFEEQFVNNPNAKIIMDYGVKFSPEHYLKDPAIKQIKVATYALDYGKGRVIMFGLTGHKLANNESFLNFFDKLLAQQLVHYSPQK